MNSENYNAESPNFEQLVAIEKLQYMLAYARTSTVATIVAPLLCIPLYIDTVEPLLFNTWFALMAMVVVARYFLLKSIDIKGDIKTNFRLLNCALSIVTFVWGIGWFFFVPTSDPLSYLIYQIISLTVLFVGMVGYCVSWRAFLSFVIPLKLPELIFIVVNFKTISLPIPLGSMVAFYLAVKMALLFSKSWEKSFSLRLKNDDLINQLIAEKNASIAANVAKSEFISTASHDLRQPMQSINIFVDMIEPQKLPEYERSVFTRMRNSISVLNKMFNTLLDISKLDSGLATKAVRFPVTKIAAELENSFSDLCHEKNLMLSFHYPDLHITGDPHLLTQVLRNLLANAIQYTDKGSIDVTFENNNGFLRFSVMDTGHGIPEEDLPVIFKEFFRSEHSRSHHDGLGLGLSIVNRIVQKIGGTCSVKSTLGKGSIFTIDTQFPATTVTTSSVNSRADLPQTKTRDATSTQGLIEDGSRFDLNIGIIENDVSLQQAYVQYFSKVGFSVYTIPHEENEFTQYLAEIPKLHFILSDYRLGKHDGVFFIQKLREEFNEEIPACIVTADTSPQHVQLFEQLNINVLYKPIDIQSIEAFVSKSLQLEAAIPEAE